MVAVLLVTLFSFSLSFSNTLGSSAALNDWDSPCLEGECYYHSDAGSLKVWGAATALSDLTSAAGWSILNCTSDTLNQDIRLVCHDPDGCSHLYSGDVVDTIVRLPESCGSSAFARIGDIWVHDNQAIPAKVKSLIRAKSIAKRGEAKIVVPTVLGLTIDTNFAQVNHTKLGTVNFAIQGSSVPEDNTKTAKKFISTGNKRRPSRKRSLTTRSFVSDAFSSWTDFNKNISTTLPPINVDQSFPIISASIKCPYTNADGENEEFDASVSVAAQTKANAQISIGMAASGSIIPPKLDYAGVYAGFDGNVDASLTLKGDAKGTADIGTLTLYETAIPGLDFPGILTLGPSFKILAKATANMDIGVDLKLDMKYTASNAKLFFPPNSNYPSGGVFNNGGNPLTMSVTPSTASSGTLSAHLIPQLDLGLKALGIAKATIFLNLDASAGLTMNLDAADSITTTVAAAAAPTASSAASSALSRRDAGNVNGCVDLGTDFAVRAGADANFFGLFDKSTSVTLFEKDFDIFKKCFGSGSTSKREVITPSFMIPRDDALTCPSSSTIFDQLVSIADQS